MKQWNNRTMEKLFLKKKLKKIIFEKKNFSGPRPDTPYLRKFWKKNFFLNFCFFSKKKYF